MKTQINSKKAGLTGSVLIVTMCIIGVAAIVLGSYLCLVQTQSASVARSQSWNGIVPISEAGLEEAMATINSGSSNFLDPTGKSWTGTATSDGWTYTTNNDTYSLTRYVPLSKTGTNYNYGSSNYYYTVTISNVANAIGTEGPTIVSQGYVPYTTVPWVFSMNEPGRRDYNSPMLAAAGLSPMLAQVTGGSSTTTVGRSIKVRTAMLPLFAVGVAAKNSVNLSGKNVLINSYDSTSTNYSTLVTNTINIVGVVSNTMVVGNYDSSKSRSGGDVGVDAAIIGDVNTGNGTINGHVQTGPGDVQSNVQIGPNGAIGASSWTTAGNTGIEGSGTTASWWSPDFNVSFPDVKAPTYIGLPFPGAVLGYSTLTGGNNYTTVVSSLGNVLVTGTGTVQLWVNGSCSFSSLTIASTNVTLILYVGRATGSGDSFTGAGNNAMNYPGYPKNFQIFGLPSCTSVDMSGNAGWAATVYVPDATFKGGGGGANTQDTMGAIVAKAVTLNGHWNFHYDESLKVNGANRGWVAKSWQEQ